MGTNLLKLFMVRFLAYLSSYPLALWQHALKQSASSPTKFAKQAARGLIRAESELTKYPYCRRQSVHI